MITLTEHNSQSKNSQGITVETAHTIDVGVITVSKVIGRSYRVFTRPK
jgi:hypothetical protein